MTDEGNKKDPSQGQNLVPTPGGQAVPSKDSDPIKKLKIQYEASIYIAVIAFLGIIVLSVIFIVGYIVLSPVPAGGTAKVIPEGLIAIGSAAVGAMAGMLAPSPANKT